MQRILMHVLSSSVSCLIFDRKVLISLSVMRYKKLWRTSDYANGPVHDS